jgi:hypothetical protein
MVINLLDCEDGVTSLGHDGLVELCEENGWQDINDKTESECGRFFLWEADAADLRAVVVDN